MFPGINEEYPPRALVELFLKEQYTSYKKTTVHDIVVEERFEEIVDLNQTNNQWQLITKDKSQQLVNTLFLCLGHSPSYDAATLKIL